MPSRCWSRQYFPKNDMSGKFECIFCNEPYKDGDGVRVFKRHLLKNCKEIDAELRDNLKKQTEGTLLKKRKIDSDELDEDLLSLSPSTSTKSLTSNQLLSILSLLDEEAQGKVENLNQHSMRQEERCVNHSATVMSPEKTEIDAFRARKIALITGITGQDGSYLAELLLSKGYKVHGVIRRSSSFNTGRIEHLYSDPMTHSGSSSFSLHYGDMTDSSCLIKLISSIQPSEVYHLAAQSHVKVSFDLPEYTAEVDAVGTLRLLDAIHVSYIVNHCEDRGNRRVTVDILSACNLTKKVRFYQASTSELYGKVQEIPQTENTPFYPRSPYAVAKLYAYWIVVNYREAYGMFACNGILFNHESPRRGATFVTRKITRAVAKISLGQQEVLELGNLNSLRDWGHAREYVEGMWKILQHDKPDDFVLATNKHYSVKQFVEYAFAEIGKIIVWEGENVNEVGREKDTGIVRVKVNPKFYRPTEVELLIGDASKAKRLLGWEPKIDIEGLVKEMVQEDVALMTKNPMA